MSAADIKHAERQARHLRAFEEALAPDPQAWKLAQVLTWEPPAAGSMRGNDQPSCVCGQLIRTAYVLRRDSDGKQVTVGSTCIRTSVPFLISHGAGAVARTLEHAVRQHRRELEQSAAAAEAHSLIEDHQRLIGWLETAARVIARRWPGPRYEDRWVYSPHHELRRVPNARMSAAIAEHGPLPFIPRYDAWPDLPASKTRSGVRSSRKRIAASWVQMWQAQSGIPADLPAFPLPAADAKLRELMLADVDRRIDDARRYADIDPQSRQLTGKLERLRDALAAEDDTVPAWTEPNPQVI